MGAGLVQIIANKSEETEYLTGNPEISLFKIVYRRHTNFAIESQEHKFLDDPFIGGKLITMINRDADLCNRMYLVVILPTVNGSSNQYIYGVGNALIKEVSIDIGGTIIDTHYSQWLDIWTELTIPPNKKEIYDRMVANRPANDFLGGANNTLYIPLHFWFNRNIGLALPLLALQNNVIKLSIQLATYSELTFNGTITDSLGEFSCKLFIDYIFLDNDEKRHFNQSAHEYLFEQVQYMDTSITSDNDSNKTRKIELYFERPIKEIIWVHHQTSSVEKLKYVATDIYSSAKLYINGNNRFMERGPKYFRLIQNYQCHTNTPRNTPYRKNQNGIIDSTTINYNQNINTYSFALYPEKNQPSGHTNFSRIEKVILAITYIGLGGNNYTLKIWATNYNVLRIAGGIASLVF